MTPSGVGVVPLVAIVVVNWQRRDETLACLASLTHLTYPRWQLVLVDNGCFDFTADELARLVPGARYERCPVNTGFAGGSNRGMRIGLDAGADYVWFLNNDARPEPDALAELVGAARAASVAIIGAKILLAADATRLDSVALSVDLSRGRVCLLGHDEVDRGQYDDLAEVTAVSGCALLASRAACERLGGFDEEFFAYYEDADLCLRARAAGLRVAVAPRARVHHGRATATRGRQSVESLYYASRNHLRLIDRHGAGPAWRRRARLVAVLALNAAFAARPGAGSLAARLRAVWRGARDFRRGVHGPAR